MNPNSRFVRSGSVSIHAQDWGGSGPTLLLIHGSVQNGGHWREVALPLPRHFRVLTMDLRGHGRSEGGPDDAYDLPTMAGDAIAVLDALEVEKATIVGQSLGGRIAYGITALHPHRVERLVVVDMSPNASPGSLTFWQEMARLLPERFDSRREAEAWISEHEMEFLSDTLLESGDGSCRFDLNLPALVRVAAQTSSVDQWELVARIACPTLIVRALRSPYIDDETAERLNRIPGFAMESIDAGHALHLEVPEALTTLMERFVR